MKILKLLAVILIAYGLYSNWDKLMGGSASKLNELGFSAIVMPDDAKPDDVIIYTAPNCPSAIAQRGRTLFRELRKENIPVKKSSRYAVRSTDTSREFKNKMQRTFSILESGGVTVLVGGYGKTDPTLDEVISQYQRNKSSN